MRGQDLLSQNTVRGLKEEKNANFPCNNFINIFIPRWPSGNTKCAGAAGFCGAGRGAEEEKTQLEKSLPPPPSESLWVPPTGSSG